jgi:hypothetical protein
MKVSFAIGLAALALAGIGCTKARAQELKPDPDREVELTVYTADFAQVDETRTVSLVDGTVRIGLDNVSHALDESTILYDWPEGTGAQVTSTTYDLGTSSGQSLLEQLVGKEVTLVYRSDNGRAGERQTGILESAAPGNLVVRVGNTLVVNPVATIETPAGSVATMPRVTASIENGKDEETKLGVSYMTRGLSWEANYVMMLTDETSDLECWATVENHTGIDFPAAKIKFVAGSPNRAVMDTLNDKRGDYDLEERFPAAKVMRGGAGGYAMEAMPQMLGELIAYPYESKATLRNNQTNRVLMMKEPKVTVNRDYSIRLPSPGWYGYGDNDQRLKATLALAFKNSEEAGLGNPLPAGTVRVYERGKDGKPTSIGAAQIGNTPKDDRIDLTLTEVFNLYARGKLTKTTKLDKKRTAYTYEVKLHNEKDKAVDVRLVADYYGKWTISDESTKSSRPTASSAQWTINVPAGGEQTLTYTVVLG